VRQADPLLTSAGRQWVACWAQCKRVSDRGILTGQGPADGMEGHGLRRDLRWKLAIIAILIGVSIWFAFPLGQRINLGLDLQGGMHLVLEVEAEKAVENTTERLVTELTEALKKAGLSGAEVHKIDYKQLLVKLPDAGQTNIVIDTVKAFPSLVPAGTKGGTELIYKLDDQDVRRILENAVDQALETIRNRVDQFGVAEPTIQRQGARNIVVELPGIADPTRAIQLIGKTARLEFRLVDESQSLDEALKGRVPAGSEILYERKVNKQTKEATRTPYLLKKQVLLTGDALTNAKMELGSRFGEPYVSIELNGDGARLFERITAENVGKRLAIVLDDTIYPAPAIRERIGGGRAQITGSFTDEEAKDLAIVLRAGALPAPVRIEENRTIGPSLGQDSIREGITAGVIGSLLVVLFMIVYYRFSGVVANVALVLNILMLLAGLGYLHATLTLPGIAGIVLTVGMAVDANVLIFERIREETRTGKPPRAAIDAGFARAWSAILDGHVTTLIAAAMLFQFGTGPVKGFAVTLVLGMIANLITAVFICKVIFESVLALRPIQRLSI
jgi:preprotein translocase subunit SecD